MKTKVAVLFGGRSVEHEVSIISGLQAFAALDRSKYDPIPLYITKDNRFFTGEHLGDIESYKHLDDCLKKAVRVLLVPGNAVHLLKISNQMSSVWLITATASSWRRSNRPMSVQI